MVEQKRPCKFCGGDGCSTCDFTGYYIFDTRYRNSKEYRFERPHRYDLLDVFEAEEL